MRWGYRGQPIRAHNRSEIGCAGVKVINHFGDEVQKVFDV
jgi:hypothetical protein